MSPSRGPILVVEDDPPIASGIVRGLKLAGFEVSLATNGRLALEAAEREKPRLRSFGLGAVDYLAKPFWMEELVARIRARLHLVDEGPRRVVR